MRQRPGFTLVEEMVSLVALASVMLISIGMFITASSFTNDEQARILVGETAARTLSTLDSTLREGRSVLSSGVVSGTMYVTDDTTLVLALPSIVSGQPTDDNDIVVIRRNSSTNTLEQLTAADATSSRPNGTKQLATGVNDIYFRYTTDVLTDATAVTALVSSTQTANRRPYTRTTIIYETLRNHP